MAELREIVEWLDGFLSLDSIPDYPGAFNGLQAENRSPVDRVAAATDATLETIAGAAQADAQLLLVHHGLFWGDPLPLTGITYRRVRALLDADLALYSAHLPLDVHPDIGNGVLLARALDLVVEGRFGRWREDLEVGVWATADLSLEALAERLVAVCGSEPHVIPGGPGHVRRLGIVTGGGASLISQAHEQGLDTFVTGEGAHHHYHEAMELGLNVIFAGHYATETLGVRALAEHLAGAFDLESVFLDRPTGL
ncbi:MAG: Nif3-like dinuclear metal center hexameric protein [Gemmatimonadota bacterium]|nr:MAG: Nif3-like dinuclear metal center hexameric protein [Gemmatimonadota bacterium]